MERGIRIITFCLDSKKASDDLPVLNYSTIGNIAIYFCNLSKMLEDFDGLNVVEIYASG